METAKFRRNVMRTVSPKIAKAGLRNAVRTTSNVHVLHAIVGLNTEVGALLQSMQPFLLGFQLNQDVLSGSFTTMGGVSYYLMLLAKVLKVKVPGSGKKLHLSTLTKTEALLKLQELSCDLMYQAMKVFHGESIDMESVKALTQGMIGLMWPLTYDLFNVTPSVVFEDYNNRLSAGFPEGLFSDDQEVVKTAVEMLKQHEVEVIAAMKVKPEAENADGDAEAEEVASEETSA